MQAGGALLFAYFLFLFFILMTLLIQKKLLLEVEVEEDVRGEGRR